MSHKEYEIDGYVIEAPRVINRIKISLVDLQRVARIMWLLDVRPGTRLRIERLGLHYARYGDCGWEKADGSSFKVRMQGFSMWSMAHEVMHIVQAQRFKHMDEWDAAYTKHSTARPVFSARASKYHDNPYEVEARAAEHVGAEVSNWIP